MNIKTTKLLSLSDRLNYALQLTGTKKADLARAIDVKPQVIQFLCSSHTQSSRFTFEIATALGLNTRWLATGEGTMFLADDPRQQFLKSYKSIPLLSLETLKKVFLEKNTLNEDLVKIWLPLKTECNDIFAIKMLDNSMEPHLPANSDIFIKSCPIDDFSDHKFVFAYVKKFDTFVVRELVTIESKKVLRPKNSELFKDIKLTEDIGLLGLVVGCFWHIRS